ncbi:MAG: hypothetical protein AAF642_08640 [Pseudomonadota bacterium]
MRYIVLFGAVFTVAGACAVASETHEAEIHGDHVDDHGPVIVDANGT